jgi:hypothetical protein
MMIHLLSKHTKGQWGLSGTFFLKKKISCLIISSAVSSNQMLQLKKMILLLYDRLIIKWFSFLKRNTGNVTVTGRSRPFRNNYCNSRKFPTICMKHFPQATISFFLSKQFDLKNKIVDCHPLSLKKKKKPKKTQNERIV